MNKLNKMKGRKRAKRDPTSVKLRKKRKMNENNDDLKRKNDVNVIFFSFSVISIFVISFGKFFLENLKKIKNKSSKHI